MKAIGKNRKKTVNLLDRLIVLMVFLHKVCTIELFDGTRRQLKKQLNIKLSSIILHTMFKRSFHAVIKKKM